jgi:hypothetical protein
MTTEIEKQPTQNQSVNKPASGTYGEKVELDRLRKALPDSGARPSGGPAPAGAVPGGGGGAPTGDPGRPAGPSAPPGVPGAMMHESDRPNQPLATPLSRPEGPMAGAQTHQDARFVVLQALSESEEVSEATREWASIVIEMLTEV